MLKQESVYDPREKCAGAALALTSILALIAVGTSGAKPDHGLTPVELKDRYSHRFSGLGEELILPPRPGSAMGK